MLTTARSTTAGLACRVSNCRSTTAGSATEGPTTARSTTIAGSMTQDRQLHNNRINYSGAYNSRANNCSIDDNRGKKAG
jgi:hypothetical protein